MRLVPRFLLRALYEFRLRHRFPRSVIHIGATADRSSRLGDSSVLFANARLIDSALGNYSYVQERSALYGAQVGPFCSIAGNVTIGLLDHPTFMVSTSPVFYDNTQPLPVFFVPEKKIHEKMPRTVIEADVWIGEGVRVRAGVRIGVGSVIGAGAVVTQDIASYAIAAGVPCKVVKDRFPEEIRKRLLDSKWWELDQESLCLLAPEFVDPIRFLSALEDLRERKRTLS